MTRRALSIASLIALAVATVGAQSNTAMHDNQKMNAKAANEATYLGCLEAGEMAHAFVLTHLTSGDGMQSAMMPDSKKGTRGMDDRHDGAGMTMLPSVVSLNVAPVDVSGHVGHKVAIVGSLADGAMGTSHQTDSMANSPVLTVKSVKMLATTCP